MKQEKIAFYNQQCVRAGQRCYDKEMIEQESDDLVIFHLTEDNIQEEKEFALSIINKPLALKQNDIFKNRLYSDAFVAMEEFEATL